MIYSGIKARSGSGLAGPFLLMLLLLSSTMNASCEARPIVFEGKPGFFLLREDMESVVVTQEENKILKADNIQLVQSMTLLTEELSVADKKNLNLKRNITIVTVGGIMLCVASFFAGSFFSPH